MRYKVMAAISPPNIAENLSNIRARMTEALEKRTVMSKEPCLVAISKTKPLTLVREAYQSGQRHFGENYMKELIMKSNNPDIKKICPDLKWHYVGSFTKKMASSLMKVSDLHMLETLPGKVEADAVNKRWPHDNPLKVLVQVNTSGEESKSGVTLDGCSSVVNHILTKCPKLEFSGLMSIGARGHDYSQGSNPDFDRLVELRSKISEEFSLKEEELELSMGMSGDYEEAIKSGSTLIRIGTTIFGARDYPEPPPT